MINFTTTVVHGFAICIPFSIFAICTFWTRPRLWLHSLPLDIQEMAGPKTDTELKQTRWLVVAVLILLPGCSVASLLYVASASPNELTVVGAFAHLYGIWVIVHLWDLFVIDLGHVLFINSDLPPIPNTQGASGYKDFSFHARAFVKACILSLLFVGPAALIIGLAI